MPIFTAPDGTELAYHVRGEGEPLVVLPGGPMRASVYLGDLGAKPTDTAQRLQGQMEGSDEAVLVAVSPEQRVVEVVTGSEARVRLPDRGAKLAVMSMVASFKEGDLLGGLLSGLRMLADQAGSRRR